MHKRYSVLSVVFVIIGLLIAAEPYLPLQLWSATSWGHFFLVVFVGVGIYFIGVIFGIAAFAKKEMGLLKYVFVFSVIIGFFLVGLVM